MPETGTYIEDLAALKVEVKYLINAVDKLTDRVESLTEQANKWRGGIALMLALGAIAGWMIDHGIKFLVR